MDLSEYASELFLQHGELHVPGLGYFVRKRIGSYYEDGTMHPPSYKVSFTRNAGENNDELINYFASQKRISPASAKYFVDKFVAQFTEHANDGEADFAGIGSFITENGELIFKPRQLNPENDPLFFGYAPVKINRLDQHRQADSLNIPVLEEAAAAAYVNDPAAEDAYPHAPSGNGMQAGNQIMILDSAGGKDQQTNNNILLWTFFVSLAALLIGGFVYYYLNYYNAGDKYDSATNPVNQSYNTEKAKPKPGPLSSADRDTNNLKNALSADSAASLSAKKAMATPPVAPDIGLKPAKSELPLQDWIVSGGQNNNYDGAVRQVTRYRKLGYPQARLIDSVKKKDYFVYKIVFGVYDNREQAFNARTSLLKERKLKPKYITVQQVNSNK